LRISGFKKFFEYCKENEECVEFLLFHQLKICKREICKMGEKEREEEREGGGERERERERERET